MGNSCVGPSISKNGIIQSFSAAIWRTHLPEPEGSVANRGSVNDVVTDNEPDSPLPVQNKPPEQITIPKTESEKEPEKEKKKERKPSVKRSSSAGLRVDSVLQRETGNFKDFFSLGKKLGQGHPWVQVDGVAPDKPLDSAVLSRLKQFSAMNKLKKMALIADIDNSGTIDYGEFIAATLHLNKVEREDHLFAAFSYFDKDGSGYITQEELQQACDEFGIKDVGLDEIIKEIDEDNDGRIDYNEFVAMMQKGNVPMVGKKGLENNFSIRFKEALKL
ncbi:hypothetical protein RYX36_017931 [Vicia faba]